MRRRSVNDLTIYSGSLVMMMQPADLRDCDDLALRRRFDLSWSRRVPLQGLMWPGVVIVIEVLSQNPTQVILIDNNQVVETLSANRSDYAFGVWILERRSRRGDYLFDLHSFHSEAKFFSVDLI